MSASPVDDPSVLRRDGYLPRNPFPSNRLMSFVPMTLARVPALRRSAGVVVLRRGVFVGIGSRPGRRRRP